MVCNLFKIVFQKFIILVMENLSLLYNNSKFFDSASQKIDTSRYIAIIGRISKNQDKNYQPEIINRDLKFYGKK